MKMKKVIFIIAIFVSATGILLVSYKMNSSKSSNTKITYSINNNMSSCNSKYSQRGVYYDTLNRPDAPHLYTIAMGEKNTGGYSIIIKDVIIDAHENVEVIVQENSPGFEDILTMAFTYPTCMLELNELPNSLVVKNTNRVKFKNINF